jgi:Tfp pilus assembly protein FimT
VYRKTINDFVQPKVDESFQDIHKKGAKMRLIEDCRGITLLELMIVCVILTVVVGMAAPRFGKIVPQLKFQNASRDVVSDMRMARSEAVSKRAQYGLYFNSTLGQYLVFKDLVNLTAFTYDIGDSVIKTVTLDSDLSLVSCTFNNYVIVFSPDGTASGSGSVTLGNTQGTDQANVDVLASTGRVKLTLQ